MKMRPRIYDTEEQDARMRDMGKALLLKRNPPLDGGLIGLNN